MAIADLFKQINEGNFSLACVNVKLAVNPSRYQIAFEGSGFIKINKNGFFEYDLIVTTDKYRWIQEINPNIPREEEYQYFQLQIVDESGRKWIGVEETRPIIRNIFTAKPGKKFSIFGSVGSILTYGEEESATKSGNDHYQFIIPNIRRLPWTGWKKTTTKKGQDEEESFSGKACYRDINIDGISIELEQFEDSRHLLANIKTIKGQLPPFIDIKVLETIQFMTADLVNFGVQIREGKNQNFTRLIAQHNHLATRHPPPIAITEAGDGARFWNAFESVLRFLLKNDSDNPFFHPLMETINIIMEASSRTEGIRSLTLAIAIESIVNNCSISDRTESSSYDSKEISRILKFISRCIKNEGLKKRLIGFVNSIKKNPWRAKDRLLKLASDGVISHRQLKSWEELRHPSAHGSFSDVTNKENLETLLGDVYTLAHTLVLREAMFEGTITNYGSE